MFICEFCKINEAKGKKHRFCSLPCYHKSKLGVKQSKEVIGKRVSKLIGKKRTMEQKIALSKSLTGIKRKITHHNKQFKKGHTPWSKGIKMSQEFKDKIRDLNLKGIVGMKGKKQSYEHKEKIRLANVGKKVPLDRKKLISATLQGIDINEWKGFKRSPNYLLRRSFRDTIGKKVLERDNYTCQICGERGGDLQVDHIQEWSKYVELRFDINNCRTLCVKCHYKITFGKPMPPTVRAWGHNIMGGKIL